MKKVIMLLITVLAFLFTKAQNTAWRTGVRDTSFSNSLDFRKTLKSFPFIKLVGEQPNEHVMEKRNLTYHKIGTRELKIDAFLPKQNKKSPAVLIVHGGGWRSGDRSQHIPLAQQLAVNGMASFTVEYRLSTEALYPAAVLDLKTAIIWLKSNAKKFNIDTSKIAILGFSAGGQLAALVGLSTGVKNLEVKDNHTKHSSQVNAVIDIDGTLSFVNPEAWETQNPDKINASAMWLGYPRTEKLDLWEEASPLTHAKENQLPFLFLNSSVERMHAGRDEFKKMMDKKGVYTEVVSFENTPHTFCLYEPWFSKTVDRIVKFLSRVFDEK